MSERKRNIKLKYIPLITPDNSAITPLYYWKPLKRFFKQVYEANEYTVYILAMIATIPTQPVKRYRLLTVSGSKESLVDYYINWLLERNYIKGDLELGFVATLAGKLMLKEIEAYVRALKDNETSTTIRYLRYNPEPTEEDYYIGHS